MILDTNALSAMADGDAEIAPLLRQQTRIALPAIVLGEFRYGIAQSTHLEAYERWLAQVLPSMEVLPVGEETAMVYAELCLQLRRSGRPIPTNDIWISALARQHGLPVLSRDAHFDAVAGIDRQAW